MARRAMRLDPNHPAFYRYALFRESYFTGRFGEALADLKRINLANLWVHHVFLAITHAQLGDEAAARAEAETVLTMNPAFTVPWFLDRFRFHETLRPAFLDGAKKAGLPLGPTG